MIFLYVLFLFFPFCIADGVHEANVGEIHYSGDIQVITTIGSQISLKYDMNGVKNSFFEQYNLQKNIESIGGGVIGADLLPHLNEGGYKLKGEFGVGLGHFSLASFFALNFGFVVIPYRDGVQISDPEFTATRLTNTNPTPQIVYSFNMVFTDPTLATAESHVYSIEFWDCLNGQGKLDEYSKKTVKRGEAIITVNYTP